MHSTTLLAENHICISKALFREGIHATENKAYKKTIQKLALILLALYLAVAAWLWYTGGSPIFLLGESVFLGALFFWLFVMLPGAKQRSKYKAMAQGENITPERTVKFYQNHLSVTANTGKETIIQYDDILNWRETKHLYILNCNNNISVMLNKNGFVIGDFHVVQSLLQKM